jgi:hypothetical protein
MGTVSSDHDGLGNNKKTIDEPESVPAKPAEPAIHLAPGPVESNTTKAPELARAEPQSQAQAASAAKVDVKSEIKPTLPPQPTSLGRFHYGCLQQNREE